MWESSKYCIHPEGKLYFRWNICLTLTLLYISIAVPLQVTDGLARRVLAHVSLYIALYPARSLTEQMGFRLEADPWSEWKVIEICFDSFFIVDFCLNFW